jgi:hypothetical protein
MSGETVKLTLEVPKGVIDNRSAEASDGHDHQACEAKASVIA